MVASKLARRERIHLHLLVFKAFTSIIVLGFHFTYLLEHTCISLDCRHVDWDGLITVSTTVQQEGLRSLEYAFLETIQLKPTNNQGDQHSFGSQVPRF